MQKLKKIWGLSGSERRLLARAGLLLMAAEAGLRVLPFRTLLAWAQKRGPYRFPAGGPTPERAAYLVDVAASHTFLRGALRPTCLRKSLVLCRLLSCSGRDARLVIGTGSLNGNFQAHAWVELDGQMLGTPADAAYRELASFAAHDAGRQIA